MRVVRAGLLAVVGAVLFATLGEVGVAADPPAAKARQKKGKKQAAQQRVPAAAATSRPAAAADAGDLSALIDRHIDSKLAAEGVSPAPAADDSEFVRRAFLDLAGVIPPADEAKRFLDDPDPAKRAKLIDALLASDRYGRRLADVWTALLLPTDSDTRFVDRKPFDRWLCDSFNANRPWDQTVRTLVTASGDQESNPATTFFLTNRSVDKLTDAVTQHLLGVRLGCAQCHNHPFTDWKQSEYWGLAAAFSKVQPEKPGNPARGGNANPAVRELAGRSRAKEFFPEGAKTVPVRFLGTGADAALKPGEPFRPALADWMTAPDNPFLGRAMVNRVWFHLFGRGLVNPVDDLHADNPASHPELLDELSRAFVQSGFDLKHLTRGVANSRAYQRTSRPGATPAAPALFARQTVKVMAPEMLFDSLTRVTGFQPPADGRNAKGQNLPKGVPFSPRDRFVTFYLAGADTPDPVGFDAGIPQALKLMNNRLLTGGPGAALKYAVPREPVEANVERLYLATLSRRPTPAEVDRVRTLVARRQPAERYGDLLWALLNSSEFATIR